jgi:hypothetical protein
MTSQEMPQPNPDPAIVNPNAAEVAAQSNQDPDSPGGPRHNFHATMRNVNAMAGYMVGGTTLAIHTPGIAPKVVGAAMALNGLRETKVATDMAMGRPEAAPADSGRGRLRERIFMFANSLVENNTGKMNLAARLKRRTGEEVLNFQDREFRNRYSRMMGGMAVLLSGVQFAEQPGVANKIIGITLGNIGMAEQLFNTQKVMEYKPETAASQP